MILDELASFIATNSTLVVGTDLFKAGFPATAADTAVAIYETGGVSPKESFGGVVVETPSVQVLVRSTSYSVARNLAQTIWNDVVSISNSTLTGVGYAYGRAQQSPFSIGNDELNRELVSCNYFIDKEVSST